MKTKFVLMTMMMMMAAVALSSCAGTKLSPGVVMQDGLNVAAGAGAGYLAAGKAGAAAGAMAAELGNLKRLAKTAAKQPVGEVNP